MLVFVFFILELCLEIRISLLFLAGVKEILKSERELRNSLILKE